MKIWILSDTHFNHPKMIEYCDRPKNFEELLWAGLKELKEEDLLIHLGDICIGKDKEVHQHLQGISGCRKILVKGNHDMKSNNWYLENGWDFVCDFFYDKYYNTNIYFSHRPILDIGKNCINIHGHFHNTLPRLNKKQWAYATEEEKHKNVLAGITDQHRLLAVEYTNYKPISLESFFTK